MYLGTHTFVHLQTILRDLTLIEAHPAKHGTIGIERKRAVETELLLIHPVGNTVDDLVLYSILGYLTLCIVIQKFYEEDVIVADERHLLTVVAPHGNLLRTVVGEFLQESGFNIVNVIYCGKRMTVDSLCLCLNQHLLSIRTQDIIIIVV